MQLDCTQVTLRAARRSKDVDKEQRQFLANAFLLRAGENGLSVNFDCTAEECASQFKKCHGVSSLLVGRVRSTDGAGLDVIPDEPEQGTLPHANIVGMPDEQHDPGLANRIAKQLADQSRMIWPEEMPLNS